MSTGGSASRKAKRVRKPRITSLEKRDGAIERAEVKVNQVDLDSFDEIVSSWRALRTVHMEAEQAKGNGIIINLLNLGISQIEVKSMLGCGSNRVERMRDRITAGTAYVEHE